MNNCIKRSVEGHLRAHRTLILCSERALDQASSHGLSVTNFKASYKIEETCKLLYLAVKLRRPSDSFGKMFTRIGEKLYTNCVNAARLWLVFIN